MSVVLKMEDGQIILYTKGADSVIKDLLCETSLRSDVMKKTQIYVDGYAKEGLRTLFCAYKVIDKQFYEVWKPKVEEARNTIFNREAEVERVDGEIETGLTLIGSTAIEDKL